MRGDRAVVLSWRWPLSPGNCSNACRYFLLSPLETVLFYLANRSQGCFPISHNTQDSSPTQRIIWSQMSIVQGWEKLGQKRTILEVFILHHHWKGPSGYLEWLGLPGRLSELTMQVATEDPNRTSRAQFCHFWQNANAWVRNVSGKVWSAGLVPGTEIVRGKEKALFPHFLKCKLLLKLLPKSIWNFLSQMFNQYAQ